MLEGCGPVINLIADIFVGTDIEITTFLGEELGMKHRTDQEIANIFLRMMEWADPLGPPTVLALIVEIAPWKHLQACIAKWIARFRELRLWLILEVTWITRDTRFGLKVIDNVF